jgi:hypothetical protein
MILRWVMPLICCGLLIAAEVLTVDSMLLPQASTLAFLSLYLLVPALSLLLALLLSASSAKLFCKLLFPVVALVGIPLGYLFHETTGGSAIDLHYLSTDLGLALIFAFCPAVLGTAMGLALRAIVSRRRQKPSSRGIAGARTGRSAVGTQSVTSRNRGGGVGAQTGRGRNGGTGARVRAGAGAGPRLTTGPKLRVTSSKRTGAGRTGGTEGNRRAR